MNELLLDTLIDGFDERFDVSFLTENQRRRRKRELRRRGIVDCDACGIVSAVLQSPQAIEENLQDVLSLSVEVVIQIRKYSTHFLFSSSLSKPPDLRFIVFSFIILWGPFCLTSLWLRELAFCPPRRWRRLFSSFHSTSAFLMWRFSIRWMQSTPSPFSFLLV